MLDLTGFLLRYQTLLGDKQFISKDRVGPIVIETQRRRILLESMISQELPIHWIPNIKFFAFSVTHQDEISEGRIYSWGNFLADLIHGGG